VNILVISGRTARQPWTSGALAARICAALAAKGHTITLACQSLDDPALFAACKARHVFNTFDQTATDWPLGFASWARTQRRHIPHDVCLSLSRIVGGDVWMPLDPGGASWLTRARRTLSLKSLAIAATRHHGAFRAWATEATLGAPWSGAGGLPLRVIAIGATSAGEVSRALHRIRGLGDRVIKADPFGILDPPPPEVKSALRASTRAALDISPDRRVVLISATLPVGTTLDGLLLATRELAEHDQSRAPILLILGRDCFALHARATRLGAAPHARILGLTERMDAALSAADAVALPHKADRGLFASGAVGRLGVDALRFGRPILALSGASGYGVARLRSPAHESPGLVIDYPTAEAWLRALRQLESDTWLEHASTAAADIGAPMRFDRFADRLDATLSEVAAERTADRARR
jgi:hypothetical protein